MSMLGEQIKELREAADRLEGYQNGDISRQMREAADTIEGLQDRLQREDDALRDYRAEQIATEAERRLQESYGQVPEQEKRGNEDERESYATQECHATQPNYEHCKYSTNRGWRDVSRYAELFGTPERTAQTLIAVRGECESSGPCYPNCPFGDAPACPSNCESRDYVALIEWLRGDA